MVIGFKAGEGGIEHFPARHNNDVEAGVHLVAPEHLACEALGAIAVDRRANLPRRRHSQPRRGAIVWQHEYGHDPAVRFDSRLVDAFELGPAADPFILRRQRSAAYDPSPGVV